MHARYAPKQRSCAQVLAPIAVPNLAAPKKHTRILESEPTNKEKLSSAEVKSIKENIEAACRGARIQINAISIRPTNAGGIAVDVEKEADKETAANNLNSIKNSTGFSTRIIPKKLPRVIVHGIPFEYLPEDSRNEIVKECQDIEGTK